MKKFFMFAAAMLILASCSKVKASDNEINEMKEDKTVERAEVSGPEVEIKTTMGDIVVKLYDDTPLHRDNFLKLVEDGFYEDVLFHRVINEFMVQAGDPQSKGAPQRKMLGGGDPGYTIEAEILYPKHYHKYGALAAARTGDQVNPQKRSSGSQFYIVTGKQVTPQEMQGMSQRQTISKQRAYFNQLVKEYADTVAKLQAEGDREALENLQMQIMERVQKEVPPVEIDEAMASDYTTVGGAPFLDGEYTVFGEVIKGMDVVENIQKAETDRNDRPVEDIKILSTKVLKK